MTRILTKAELAKEAGARPELVDRLVAIGALAPDADGLFKSGDIIRVDAVKSFLDAGFTIGQLGDALGHGLFTFEYLDRFYSEPSPLSETTLEDLARSEGVVPEVLTSIYLAMGLTEPAAMREDEVEIVRRFFDLWNVDEEAAFRAARLIGEPVKALAEGWTRLYLEKISRPLDARELPIEERTETIVETTEKATQLAPEMLLWLLQKHMSHAIARANIEGLEILMTRHGLVAEQLPTPPAMAFVDISGFTSMTEDAGDQLAVSIADRLRQIAQETIRGTNGQLVKLLGDGAMLHFTSATSALQLVTELIHRLEEEGIPAHAGIHAGTLIERDGDYFGTTVNVTSRIAGMAGPGEIALTDEVLADLPSKDFDIDSLDPVDLKGIRQPVAVHIIKGRAPAPMNAS